MDHVFTHIEIKYEYVDKLGMEGNFVFLLESDF